MFGVALYLIWSIWGGRNGLVEALHEFNWWYLLLLLLLSLGNYLIRFIKWQYYLKVLGLKVPTRDSLLIHMSGLGLSITPGKLGEVVKSLYLKKGFNHPIVKTAPIVLADRLTDVMALVIMSAIGVAGFGYGQDIIWTVAALVATLFLIIIIRPLGKSAINLLSRLPIINKKVEKLNELYDSSYVLLYPTRIILPLIISIISWSFEAVGFYFVFVSFGIKGFLAPFFIYSFSTIVGAVSMLPGGLGATEGTITGLMKMLNIDLGIASLATMIIRATTLWFAVLIGLICLIIVEKKYD